MFVSYITFVALFLIQLFERIGVWVDSSLTSGLYLGRVALLNFVVLCDVVERT